MTELAHYAFLPWMRVGIAAEISEPDTLGRPPADPATGAKLRAQVGVTLKLQDVSIVDGSTQTESVTKTAQFIGPGDILGIARNAIVRTEPRDQVGNFEANCFPYVEFYEEDFPWRYTPAAPNNDESWHLRPWIMLLVLQEDEYSLTPNPQGLAVLTLNADKMNNVLFPHTQSWAWAHVHFYHDLEQAPGTAAYAGEVTQTLKANPDSAVSRVLCPRKLQAEKSYRAFLVPAFETGRLAGLNEDPSEILAQTPSWQYGAAPDSGRKRPNEFPVYFQWGFRTSLHGDFKSLAALLKPKLLGPEFGKRPLDISRPGFGMDALGAKLESPTLGLEGALKPVGFQSDAWPQGPHDRAYRDQLQAVLNVATDLLTENFNRSHLPEHPFYPTSLPDDPILTPHVYGKFHALITRLGAPGNPAWVETLNLDPRHRATAGLGAQVVQEHQEEFMESAWKQIGDVNAANQRIRELELAKQVNQALYAKRIELLDDDKLVQVTAPMHGTILDEQATVHETVQASRIPAAAKSAAMRKMVRPGKKIIRRMNRLAAGSEKVLIHQKMIQHFNLAPEDHSALALTAAQPKAAPEMTLSLNLVQSAVAEAVSDFQSDTVAVQHAVLDTLAALKLHAYDAALLKQTAAGKLGTPGALALANQLIDKIQSYQYAPDEIVATVEAEMFKTVFGKSDTGKYQDGVLLRRPLGKNEGERITGTTSLEEVKQYQSALVGFGQAVQAKAVVTAARPKLEDLPAFGVRLRGRLQPEGNLNKRVAATLKIWSAARQEYVPVAAPARIMAYPEFRQPMYEHLHQISQDFIIPNCGDIPQNSLTLLQPNAAFIEAYLAGLNHEMARELLWREYPTDQRGSYFRKFWDTKDSVTADPAALNPDVKPLTSWSGNLGRNSLRADDLLVLVIRGELMLKYPNTVVYAQRAQWVQAGKKRTLFGGDDISDASCFRFPVVHARLDPDILLFGFALSAAEAHGDAVDPGWFFVLKERPGQVRFGLDDAAGAVAPAADLQHLTWSHFAPDPAAPDLVPCLDLNQANLASGVQAQWQKVNSADLASYLFRNPVLLARHAREMIA